MQGRSKVGAAATLASALLLCGVPAAGQAQTMPPGQAPYINFETIPTRALSLSPDGTRLFVTNTPDSRLEIFSVGANGQLTPAGSVVVGLDPIAVAARTDGEVWVVNHLSDSVSIVDVSGESPRVVRTLLVGDEPRDVVFAGPDNGRAFVTAARRGQNHPDNVVEETQVKSTPRADVWVFDATNPGGGVGGEPLTIVKLFSDKPGAMTVSPDGRDVFVSVFTSGNETTIINDGAVCGDGDVAGGNGLFSNQDAGPCRLPNGGMAPGGTLGPNVSLADPTVRSVRTGVIVKFNRDNNQWQDAAGRDWSDVVQFELPDNDVFVIDAMANPPAEKAAFQHAGTLNFSLAAHPTNGKVFLASIEAINLNRFLSVPRLGAFPNPNPTGGAAQTADPVSGKTLNGHLYESRVAILEDGGKVTTRHLNKHIDYEVVPSPAGVKEKSVANPQGLAFSADGSTLFVAALGSNSIVPFKTAELENDSFEPDASTHIQLSGNGGPTDMVFSATDPNLMFVYKRFDNQVAVVDVSAKREVSTADLFSPEPQRVQEGRKFFYDARLGSSNGEANCNVCHPSADKDDLAWDLGTPFFGLKRNPNFFVSAGLAGIFGTGQAAGAFSQFGNGIVAGTSPTIEFNPFKGPMTVLTLRGLADSGPMFWRGDASVAAQANANLPVGNVNPTDERAAFKESLPIVFEALLGRDGPLPETDFDVFTDWALSILPPPNPHRPLDNRLNPSQQAGMTQFFGPAVSDVVFTCENCHGTNPAMGFFGTRGEDVVEGETQFFKVTQLRTVYDKVGMFGRNNANNQNEPRPVGAPLVNVGPQVRGTGTLHDGSDGGPQEFLTAGVFQLNATQLKNVVDFVFAFPSNLASVVGQQVTLRADSSAEVNARIDMLQQRAAAPFVMPGNVRVTECDLIARGTIDGQDRGFLFQPASMNFMGDNGQTMAPAALRQLAQEPGQELTFTCVYPGGGRRLALDRGN